MATNLAIDPALIEEAREAGHHRTKKAAVTAALQEYVDKRARLKILELTDQVDYDDDYDIVAERRKYTLPLESCDDDR